MSLFSSSETPNDSLCRDICSVIAKDLFTLSVRVGDQNGYYLFQWVHLSFPQMFSMKIYRFYRIWKYFFKKSES